MNAIRFARAPDLLAEEEFEPATMARHAELDRLRKATWDPAGDAEGIRSQ